MSLAVAAIKIAALRSLKGRTSAGYAVFDSAVEPFDALRDRGAPVVVIYCDAGKRDVQGRDLFGARPSIRAGAAAGRGSGLARDNAGANASSFGRIEAFKRLYASRNPLRECVRLIELSDVPSRDR